MEKAVIYSYRTRKIMNDPTVVKKRKIRWKRLMIALAVVSIFLYGAITLVIKLCGFGVDLLQESQAKAYSKAVAQYDQVRVVIGQGETAWNLQKELTPNSDIREVLYLTSTLNPGVSMGNLQSGDVVTMLKEKQN